MLHTLFLVVCLSQLGCSAAGSNSASRGAETNENNAKPDDPAESPSDPLPPWVEPDAGLPDGGSDTNLTLDPSTLVVEPQGQELIVDSRTVPASAIFRARLMPQNQAVTVRWVLASELVQVDAEGNVTTRGIRAGSATLKAYYGSLSASAEVNVTVRLRDEVGATPLSSANATALDQAPQPDPGLSENPQNPTTILYPYDGTVMPRGLSAPVLQMSPGTLPPEDIRVEVQADSFSWNGYAHVSDPSRPKLEIPQDVWDAALATAKSGGITVRVTKAKDGKAYGPSQIKIIAADGTLKGAVYYMTYEGDALGLWSVRPGVREAPKHIVKGCVVCHSASSNGTRLSTGADSGAALSQSGVYNVSSDGTATQLTGAPTGFGGDSRALSFATFTPDGKYVMRSKNDFWGGLEQRAFRVNETNKTLDEAVVNGLGTEVSAYLPAFSHDGKRYAFTNGAGEPKAFGTVGRSLSIMDVSISDGASANGTLSFTNRELLIDNGAGGSVVKFATFMPDSDQIVFQEGEGYNGAFGEMLPTWGSNASFQTSTGRLAMVHASDKSYVLLDHINEGQVAGDKNRNYEPFSLPVSAGGYFWVVFTSIREYGNTYTGNDVRKQLWVAAISPNSKPGEDPSHPPFYLPNQGPTRNERGFWTLEPCRSDGSSCATGDECCGGFCRAADPEKPELGSVCKAPDDISCAELHERCTTAADCCGAADGAQCIGGYCDVPVPPPPMCKEVGTKCDDTSDCCGTERGIVCEANKCADPIVVQ